MPALRRPDYLCVPLAAYGSLVSILAQKSNRPGTSVAAASESRGKGVTVVMDDRIISAREVTKTYARGGGFGGSEMGTLSIVATGGVEFFLSTDQKTHCIDGFSMCPRRASARRHQLLIFGRPGHFRPLSKGGDCCDDGFRAGGAPVLRSPTQEGSDRGHDVPVGSSGGNSIPKF